jgi:phosphoribosylformylglycinamidine synthase
LSEIILTGDPSQSGAHEIAGIAGYSVGLLLQPLRNNWAYPGGFASPLKILLEASDGASDYGNKFGEPLIGGFTRSYGALLGERGERIEYVKPIMFSGGIGSIDEDQLYKVECQPGQLVAKIGGPVYRIGVGGGSASSLQVQGQSIRLIPHLDVTIAFRQA